MEVITNEKLNSYINEICSQVKFREVHREIELELKTHLQETVEEYLAEGFSEDEAVNKAINQMGNADRIGKQLNKVHQPKPEWSILVLSLFFVSLGLMAMFFIEKQGLLGFTPGPVPILFIKSCIFAIIGAATITGLYLFDFRKIEPYSGHIYWGTVLMLVLSVFAGQPVNSTNYLTLGPASINFVEISPLLLSIALAGILHKWDWDKSKKLLQGLLLCVMPLLLILACSSITAAIIYTAVCITLLIVSRAKPRAFLTLTSLVSGIIVFLIINTPYRLQRFMAFINPEKDPSGAGWLNLQLSQLINGSGSFGQGLTEKPDFVPGLHTEFVFSYLTFTFGCVAVGVLIALIVLFITRMTRVAVMVKINYARLVLSGFTTIFTVQFIWNIGMNLGFAPISGVGLPFVSYGRSQLILNAAALGIISSISRRRNIRHTC